MKKDISDFLKYAYANNRVKDLEDAFLEYPVNEEWHKGRLDNVIKEKGSSYVISCEVGDIVFVKEYKYSTRKFGNNHLFVIIDQDNTAVPIESFGMLISSNFNKLKFASNKLIKKDNLSNLKVDSIVKTDVLYKILPEQILFKIGKVDMKRVEEYKIAFYKTND